MRYLPESDVNDRKCINKRSHDRFGFHHSEAEDESQGIKQFDNHDEIDDERTAVGEPFLHGFKHFGYLPHGAAEDAEGDGEGTHGHCQQRNDAAAETAGENLSRDAQHRAGGQGKEKCQDDGRHHRFGCNHLEGEVVQVGQLAAVAFAGKGFRKSAPGIQPVGHRQQKQPDEEGRLQVGREVTQEAADALVGQQRIGCQLREKGRHEP